MLRQSSHDLDVVFIFVKFALGSLNGVECSQFGFLVLLLDLDTAGFIGGLLM